MFRSFVKNTTYILALNMLVKATWILGIEVWVQNRFTVEEYGNYYTLLNLSLIFSFLLDFGISKYQNLQSAKEQSIDYSFIKTLSLLKLGLAIIYLTLTLAVCIYMNLSFDQRFYLFVLSVSQVILSYIVFTRSIFSGLGKFILEGVFSTLDKILMTIICIVWLLSSWIDQKINHYIWIQFIGYTAAFTCAIIVLLKLTRTTSKHGTNSLQPAIKSILIFIMPFAFLNALEIINDRVGVILIQQILPDSISHIGFYSYGQRWLDAYKMFASLIAIILVTYYSIYKNSETELNKLVKYCLIFFAIPITVVSSISAYNSEYFVNLIYRDSTETSHLNFRYSILTTIPYAVIYIVQPLVLVKSKIRKLNYIFLGGLIINVIACYTLIPTFQSVGCAIAFLIASFFIGLMQLLNSSLLKLSNFFSTNTIRYLLVISASLLAPMLLPSINPFIQIGISLIVIYLMIFSLRIINKSELRDILKKQTHQKRNEA